MLDKSERTSLSDMMRARDAVEEATLLWFLSKGPLIAREMFVCLWRFIILRKGKETSILCEWNKYEQVSEWVSKSEASNVWENKYLKSETWRNVKILIWKFKSLKTRKILKTNVLGFKELNTLNSKLF